MVFEAILDPVLSPLLSLGHFWAILILGAGITLLITLAYKVFTDQAEMKRIKDVMKKHQKEIRKLQKSDPQKAMKLQQKAMKENISYMKHSMKVTLYTFIPIIIIFGWMNVNLNYEAINPDEYFSFTANLAEGLPGDVTLSSVPELDILEPTKPVDTTVTWQVKGDPGDYTLILKYGDVEYPHNVLITDGFKYNPPSESHKGVVYRTTVGLSKVHPLPFKLLGWNPGWLGTYILFSIMFSIVFRKVLKIY